MGGKSAHPFFLKIMKGRSTSLLDIANKALGLLGEDSLTSIDPPDTEAGRKLMLFFYDSIDEVQSSFYWHELIEVVKVSDLDTNDDDLPLLPEDCLRPIHVSEGAFEDLPPTTFTRLLEQTSYRYRVEAGALITPATDANLYYIRRSDDPEEWTAELQRCVYHCAAVNASQLITQDSNIGRNILEKYEALVQPRARNLQSKYKNSGVKYPQRFNNNRIRARR